MIVGPRTGLKENEMCLTCLSSAKKHKEYIAEAQKRGYIRVYKVCMKYRTGWCYGDKYLQGQRTAKSQSGSFLSFKKNVDAGFHAYLSLEQAIYKRDRFDKSSTKHYIKVCYAKPQWVKGLSLRTKEASFTHLVFPEWKRGDMTIREFRQACKR